MPQPQRPLPRTAEGAARPLRGNEIRMVFPIFRDSIDYRRPRVHNDEFLPVGLQPNDTAMTPNGEMYFNPSRFKEDFSLSTDRDKHWFVHEMVHIWQYQLGYPVMARGAIRIGLEYEYELDPAKKLSDYNMEAQGDLLADYWALKFARIPELVSMEVDGVDPAGRPEEICRGPVLSAAGMAMAWIEQRRQRLSGWAISTAPTSFSPNTTPAPMLHFCRSTPVKLRVW